MKQPDWINCKFSTNEDNGLLTGILETLEGTPYRIPSGLKLVSSNPYIKLSSNNSI
jgi:hypothetical protein